MKVPVGTCPVCDEPLWVLVSLDFMPAAERAMAVKQVYCELLAVYGDQETRGVYSIDEALGMTSMYRLWLEAERCSKPGCRHASSTGGAA
jgi:hypothetical protein